MKGMTKCNGNEEPQVGRELKHGISNNFCFKVTGVIVYPDGDITVGVEVKYSQQIVFNRGQQNLR